MGRSKTSQDRSSTRRERSDSLRPLSQTIVLLLVVLCSGTLRADETTYDGRTLAEWREQIKRLDFADPARGKYVPGLMAIVADPAVPWHSRRQAALTLGRMGEPAEPAVPLLESLLSDEEPDAATCPQTWAAKGLGLFGRLAAPTTDRLIEVLWSNSAGDFARLSVMDALSRIGTAHPRAIPALIELLDRPAGQSDFLMTRRAACEAIKFVGPAASPAIPKLLRLLANTDDTLRRLALEAIGAIGPVAGFAAPAVFDAMTLDEDPAVADAAEEALRQMGQSLEPLLVQHLGDDRDETLRRRCLRIVGSWTPLSDDAKHAIEEVALTADDSHTRLEAIIALWPLPQTDPRWFDGVLECLIADDRQVRRRTLRLLEQRSPNSERLAKRIEQELPSAGLHRVMFDRALDVLRPPATLKK